MISLALLLTIQVVLCLATPVLEPPLEAMFHKPGGEGWGAFGLVLWELELGLLTALLLCVAFIWWLVSTLTRKKKSSGATADSRY
jgi:hypothetical protein